jgi:hypothetical protein
MNGNTYLSTSSKGTVRPSPSLTSFLYVSQMGVFQPAAACSGICSHRWTRMRPCASSESCLHRAKVRPSFPHHAHEDCRWRRLVQRKQLENGGQQRGDFRACGGGQIQVSPVVRLRRLPSGPWPPRRFLSRPLDEQRDSNTPSLIASAQHCRTNVQP